MAVPAREWIGPAVAVARRPRLWPTAAAQAWRLRRDRWWARPPFLPVPDERWVRFRLVTSTGDPEGGPDPDELVAWLDWRRRWSQLGGGA